jgi:hypothetical protein
MKGEILPKLPNEVNIVLMEKLIKNITQKERRLEKTTTHEQRHQMLNNISEN